MTGICTDIANTLGQYCRKDSNAELWRLKVLVPILLGYCVGGIFGQAAFLGMKENALLLPCFFVGSIGVVYLSLPFVRKAEVLINATDENKKGRVEVVEVRRIGDPRTVGYADYTNVDQETDVFMRDLERKGSFKERQRASKVSFEDIEVHTISGGGAVEVLYSPKGGD